MALSGVRSITIGVLCLLSLASGQFQTNNPRQPCNDVRVQSGISLFSDPNFCQNFTQCDTAGNQWSKNCGGDLLFDAISGVCVAPEQARCGAWTCDASRVNTRYPGLCCENYYSCNGVGFTKASCPTGQVFNAGTGQCTQGTCVNNPGCTRSGTTNVDPPGYVCYHEATSNPCTYRTQIAPGVLTAERPCPAGTSYNSSACQCSILNPNCPGTNTPHTNTQPDGQCRASFKVEFDTFNSTTGSPRAFSDKLGTTPVELPDQAQSVGVTYTNGRAFLAGNLLTGAQPYIYWASYSNKQVMGNVVFKIVVSAAAAISGPFEIISNNYNNACNPPTLLLSGTYNGQTYGLTLSISGFTNIGIGSQIINNASLSLNINALPNELIQIRIVFVAETRAYFDAVNLQNNQVANSTQSGNLGSILGYNTCGIVLGKNFRGGNIERYQMHENCIDVNRA